MFSKFLSGQNEETLEALEMQWRLEYAKAKRKFDQKIKKKGRGRPALGSLKLPVLGGDGKGKKSLKDLTEIARSVATTRPGRRVHSKATAKKNDSCKLVLIFCFCLFVDYFFTLFFVIFCCYLLCACF